MANYPKSFNFRNGLQVDNDNFVVNSAGLVGIGTSSPQAPNKLDVHGGARILGLATVTTLGVTGVSTFYDDLKVGTGISFDASAGEITATNVVASSFNGGVIVAIATAGWTFEHGGAGISTFISVGIGTTSDTNYDLRIGSGISFTGDTGSAFYSGVVTATTFDGDLDATHLTTGTIPDARFPATLPTVSGASLTNLNASNISSGTIDAARVPTLNQNTTGTAAGLSGSPNTVLGVTTTGNLTAGSIVGAGLSVTSIGIGTATPANTFQQRATGATELQVTSDTATASVTVGREPGTSNTNNAEFRYGGGFGFPYSNAQSLDIINYGTDNVNFHLSAANSNAVTGDFHWHKGANNARLMTLTSEGRLGIGITNPQHELSVQGISTFTGAAYFETTVETGGNLTVGGNLSFAANSDITATLRGNVVSQDGSNVVLSVPSTTQNPVENAEIKARVVGGASTITKLDVSGSGYANQPIFSVRVGTTADPVASDVVVNVNSEAQNKFVVTDSGGVGIGTTNPTNSLDLKFAQRPAVFPNMTTAVRNNLSSIGVATSPGSVIYNTDTNKLQVYAGSSWVNLH